jgi:hypothetical protein
MALKLEEASWYAVGQWYAYDDILKADPARWSPGRFVLVHATRRAHIDAALAVMQKLAEAGIPFGVLTCPNRHREQMERLSGRRCLVLPGGDAVAQPYIDIAVTYRLALDVGLACGHGAGVAPRNRTKSSTVTRSRPKAPLSPAAELKRLAVGAPVPVSAARDEKSSRALRWEEAVAEPRAAEAIAELRRLADSLHREDALAALGVFAETGIGELGRLIFEAQSEVNDIVIVALDAAACQVAHDTAAFWRRLINIPIRELPAGDWPRQAEDGTLVMVVATVADGRKITIDAPPSENGPPIAWLGPQPPSWLGAGMTTAGRFILTPGGNRCPSPWLYAGLNLLLARAWSQAAPEKAQAVQRHIAAAAEGITAVLDDAPLFEELREVAAANAAYRTAFFISPFAGSGRMWEEHFDAAGRLLMVHHAPGQCGHGPIVTIDGNAEGKYVAVENRDRMIARYGAPDVARWEAHCLAGGTVDDFLSRIAATPLERPRVPFYAGKRWYLPVLNPGYDTHRDNLIILDMTAERYLPQMLDELSLLGSRVPRLVVITQEERIREAGRKTLFHYPISDLLVLPSPGGVPIADMHLPFVLDAVGVALAAVWKTLPKTIER